MPSAIDWLSPLKDDGFAEYRDSDSQKALGQKHLQDQLKNVCPNSGPQWEAFGKNGTTSLVEAKANIPEIKSTSQAKSPCSISIIEKAISSGTIKPLCRCSPRLVIGRGVY